MKEELKKIEKLFPKAEMHRDKEIVIYDTMTTLFVYKDNFDDYSIYIEDHYDYVICETTDFKKILKVLKAIRECKAS